MPLVKVNCAGLTESIVESELFGHERGAFSGAQQAHTGVFEAADGDTMLIGGMKQRSERTPKRSSS
jgi:psp operon transcriptional activator